MRTEHRTWEQMKRDNDGADWIEPSGEFCSRYSRTSISGEVNALLDEQRAAGLKEWQLVGFNGCWSCDHCNECHFKKQPETKPQPPILAANGEPIRGYRRGFADAGCNTIKSSRLLAQPKAGAGYIFYL